MFWIPIFHDIENRFLLFADDGGDGDGGGGGARDRGGKDTPSGGGGAGSGGEGDDGKPAVDGVGPGLLANAGKEDGDGKGNGKDEGPTKTVEFKGAKIEVPEAFIDKDSGEINVGAVVKAAGDDLPPPASAPASEAPQATGTAGAGAVADGTSGGT